MVTEGRAQEEMDRAYMAAAVRLSRRHRGLTGTNPSVATLVVDDRGAIIGRGVTAPGGRPHAEPFALAEAGERARGATAYVTLEPCAHHGRTPPCAQALITAGIRRVVGGTADPDPRVSGRGYALLRQAGIEVVECVEALAAAEVMSDYLIRSHRKRPEIILKMAISADGMIGRQGAGRVTISCPEAMGRVHVLRAEAHAIMVGGGTVRSDDPELTCRLPGLEGRSPVRILVGGADALTEQSRLIRTLAAAPVWLAPTWGSDPARLAELQARGVHLLAVEEFGAMIALPELFEDLSQRGIMSVLVEGGARLARSLLEERLVDRIILFESAIAIGAGGVRSPLNADTVPPDFELLRRERLGTDLCSEWIRKDRF